MPTILIFDWIFFSSFGISSENPCLEMIIGKNVFINSACIFQDQGGMFLNAVAIDTRIKATLVSAMYDMTRVAAKGYFDSADSEEARYSAKLNFILKTKFSKNMEIDFSNNVFKCLQQCQT